MIRRTHSKPSYSRLLLVLLLGCSFAASACGIPAINMPSATRTDSATIVPIPVISRLPDSSRWRIIWDDEFTGTDINSTHWSIADSLTQRFLGCCLRFGSQVWSPQNVTVHDGELHILTAQDSLDGYSYASGALTTEYTYSFLYGRIDVRAQLPQSTGLWPAFWLIPVNSEGQKVASYEVDFLEARGSDPYKISAFFHQNYQQTRCSDIGQNFSTSFHVFTLIWEPGEMEWLVDGQSQCIVNTFVPDVRMAVILDTAIGGPTEPVDQSTALPQMTTVDYVRILNQAP